jgi:hypothetical protein
MHSSQKRLAESFFVGALLFFLPAMMPGQLVAQCLEGNCYDGDGIFRYDNLQRYAGAFRQGQAEGEGTLIYPNGERYQGQFRQGQPHGAGRYWYPDGSYRQGFWQYGKLQAAQDHPAALAGRGPAASGCVAGDCTNGTGTYLIPGGAIYVGTFQQGEIHGQGICTYADGSRYEGQWVHRNPEGYGTKTWPDGHQYTGQWRRGQAVDNNGQYQYPNQPMLALNGGFVIQSGCLLGNCEDGRGTYAYADGSRYEGSFRGGRPHGAGIFYYPNGDQYSGQFAYGLPHGQGRRTNTSGQVLQGEWVEGGLVANPRPTNGMGCLSGDCQNGFGTYVFRQGDRYEGTFQGGQPHGSGLVRYQNGDRYEGEMAAGAFAGYGTFYEQSGVIFEGRWAAGKYLGNIRKSTPETTVAPTPTTKIWALIIGVSSYKYMPALRFPDDDAYRLFAFLKSPQGGSVPDERVRVLIDEDATRQNILTAMQELFLRAGPNDLVILYFSGHGLPGAFLPIDYDGVNNTLTHQEIKRMLDQSPAGYKLCLADACHSGGLLAARGGTLPNLLTKYYENLASTRHGTALIMSSKAEETSLESSGLRQGVFSHFLLRGMKGEADRDGDGVVRVQELYQYITRQVQDYTGQQQSPVIQGDYDQRMPVSVLR